MGDTEHTPSMAEEKRPRMIVVTNDANLATALATKLVDEAHIQVIENSTLGPDLDMDAAWEDLLDPKRPNRPGPEHDAEMAILDTLFGERLDTLNIMRISAPPEIPDFHFTKPLNPAAEIKGFVHGTGGRGKYPKGGKHHGGYKKPHRGR